VKKYFQRSINDDLEKISLELMFKANRKTNGEVSIAHLSLFELRIAGTAAGYEIYTALTFGSALGGPI
jgi:hypothetical protein